jgi:hypothetical protein
VKKDIAILFSMAFVVSVFIFGMVNWESYQSTYTNEVERNLYYVTVSATMYALSFLVFIMSKGFWVKAGSSIMLSIFGVNLYIELFLDPHLWNNWDKILIVVVALNFLLVNFLIEKIKG